MITPWYRIDTERATITPATLWTHTPSPVYFRTFHEARKALMDHYSEQHKQLLYQAELMHGKFIKVFMMDEG